MDFREIDITWGEVERDDWILSGLFSEELSVVMATQDLSARPDEVDIRFREPSTGREEWVAYDRASRVRVHRPVRS